MCEANLTDHVLQATQPLGIPKSEHYAFILGGQMMDLAKRLRQSEQRQAQFEDKIAQMELYQEGLVRNADFKESQYNFEQKILKKTSISLGDMMDELEKYRELLEGKMKSLSVKVDEVE